MFFWDKVTGLLLKGKDCPFKPTLSRVYSAISEIEIVFFVLGLTLCILTFDLLSQSCRNEKWISIGTSIMSDWKIISLECLGQLHVQSPFASFLILLSEAMPSSCFQAHFQCWWQISHSWVRPAPCVCNNPWAPQYDLFISLIYLKYSHYLKLSTNCIYYVYTHM